MQMQIHVERPRFQMDFVVKNEAKFSFSRDDYSFDLVKLGHAIHYLIRASCTSFYFKS